MDEWIDALVYLHAILVFVAFSSALDLFGMATAAIGVIYATGALLILCRTRRLLAKPGSLVVALSFPMLALLSTLWSVEPEATMRNATQQMFTVLVGACIGVSLRPSRIFELVALVFGGLMLVSILNLWLGVVPAFQQKDYLSGNEYFTGVFMHKNTLGFVLCLAALGFVYLGLERRRVWPWLALAALVPILVFARSTTSVIIFLLVLGMPIVAWLSRSRLPGSIQGLILATIGLTGLVVMEILRFSPIDKALELAGKGRDLSGRTDLWAIALDRAAEAPWLGVGYQSYWTADRFAGDVSLIRGMLEDSISTFHNVWFETLVGLGVLGVLALLLPLVVVSARFVYAFAHRDRSIARLAGLFFVAIVLLRSPVEASLYHQHRVETVLLVALLFCWPARLERGVPR